MSLQRRQPTSRVCPWCGRGFLAVDPRQRNCDNATCVRERRMVIQRRHAQKACARRLVAYGKVPCVGCGLPFQRFKANQTACSRACRFKADDAKRRLSRQGMNQKHNTRPPAQDFTPEQIERRYQASLAMQRRNPIHRVEHVWHSSLHNVMVQSPK